MEFTIQQAKSSDCLQLAQYINESCDGAIQYLFDKQDEKDIALEMMAQQLTRETHYSFANSIVANKDGLNIGMALSFPADGLIISEHLKQYYSPQQLRYIEYFVENKLHDSWHLDALCVCDECRSQGVGAALLDHVMQEARKYEFKQLEVFVFATNTRAVTFYERNGFMQQSEIDTHSHEFLSVRSPLLLMSKNL